MSRKVHYTGPSCGRHVEENEPHPLLMALGYGALALASGIMIVVIIIVAFEIGAGP